MKFRGQVDAILFDLDGTLIDTDDVAVANLARRLHLFAGNQANQWARKIMMTIETPGNAFITLLDKIGLDEPVMTSKQTWRKWRGLPSKYHFPLIAGIEEMWAQLPASYKIGLVTTRSRAHIDSFLNQYPSIHQRVETSVGLQDTHRLKPHPAPIQAAAQQLGVPVERCLMVGDTTIDVKSARRAGAHSVGVLCGFGQREELEQAGAHTILASTAHLLTLL